MPLYSARCEQCGSTTSYVRKIDERNDTPSCHGPMSRQLDAPMVSAMAWTGHKGFALPGGGWIEDGTAFKRHMRENDVLPESEGRQEAAIQRATREKADDKRLDAAITQAIQTHS